MTATLPSGDFSIRLAYVGLASCIMHDTSSLEINPDLLSFCFRQLYPTHTGALFVPMSVNIPEANCLLPGQVDPRLREVRVSFSFSKTF